MRFCARPFRNLEIMPGGDAYVCCPGWLPLMVGNVVVDGPRAAFNSPAAQEARASILDGSFRHCTSCPFLQDTNGPVVEVESLPTWATVRQDRIVFVNLADDRTCNLACPSCRANLIVADGEERDVVSRTRSAALGDGVLEGLKWLSVSGAGDPFASASDRALLRSLTPEAYPELFVRLHTNGLKLDPIGWDGIGPIRDRVRAIEISIDAATEATYTLNRGGDWNRLQRNLHFAAKLRKRGPVQHLQVSFVVQANNWREMEAFVDLGRSIGADMVFFSALRAWWPMPDYLARAVHLPLHGEHTAYRQHLRESAVLQAREVVLGCL